MKRFIVWSALTFKVMATAALLMFSSLPVRIPVHWNAAGQVDGVGPRAAIFALPALVALLIGLWPALAAMSPRRYRIDDFAATWWFAGLAVVAWLAYVHGVMLWELHAGALHTAHAPRALVAGACLLVVLIGNVMGKVRRNFWLGVRTPWTLADERVWYATHRLAGKTMVAGGLLALAVVLLGWPVQWATALLVIGALVPAAYSLVYWKRLDDSAAGA